MEPKNNNRTRKRPPYDREAAIKALIELLADQVIQMELDDREKREGRQ